MPPINPDQRRPIKTFPSLVKKWTVESRWLPAVNRIREQHGWDRWDFLEIANETALADLRNILLQKLSQPPAFGIWRNEPVDAIAHQKALRSEWEGE
jgi:hypothetical protein